MSNATAGYASGSLDPLPDSARHGMIAMGIIGVFSSASTFGLFVFITWRMISWRKYYDQPLASNQIFMLIYNLLLADFQQALSFLFAFHWVAENRLVGPNNACFAQGWLIQIGDVSSGMWVFSIGIHTFVNLVLHKHIPMKAFVAWVVLLWIFCVVLTAIGPITHPGDFFVPAGNWCWIGSNHEAERLYLHYIWIFLAQVGSVCIYTTVFLVLRNRLAEVVVKQNSAGPSSSNYEGQDLHKAGGLTTTTIVTTAVTDPFLASRQRIAKAARYMVVYPFAYVTLTLPLAAGRVAAMAGKNVPLVYLAVAGTMMASCGVIDVILYISTRKALVRSSVGARSNRTIGDGVAELQTRRRETRDAIRMQGLQSSGEDTDGRRSQLPRGTIVVSKSVTRSEDSSRTRPEAASAISRSESLRSLVGTNEVKEKSWLA